LGGREDGLGRSVRRIMAARAPLPPSALAMVSVHRRARLTVPQYAGRLQTSFPIRAERT